MPHGLMIAIGLGKKKPIGQEGPPPQRFKKAAEKAPEPPPEEPEPGAADMPLEDAGDIVESDPENTSGIGPEDVDYSANDLCETCANMGETGDCTKYGFPVEATGHCEAGYTPKADTVLNTVEGSTPSTGRESYA